MSSSESIERRLSPGAGVPVRIRVATALAAAAVVLAGCGLATPSLSAPAVLGTVRVAAIRGADDTLLEVRPRARLWTANGTAPVEWGLSLDAATAVQVPVGRYTLSAFSVYLSDTIVCTDNTNGAPGQTCLQPTTGTSLTCDLPVVVSDGAPVDATYQILRNGGCRLDPGLPAAGPAGSTGSAASSAPPSPDPSA